MRPAARFVSALGMALALSCAPARADESASPNARLLIERQLDAFSRDDAAAAYAEAAPGIKAMFANPNNFMDMVRGQYAPVYRHRSAEFGQARIDGDTIEQSVTFVDGDNQVWTALYKLQRQPDGQWLISGCSLIKSDDKST
jgi:hypothetical protein